MNLLSSFSNVFLRPLLSDSRGNVAIIFALVLVPILGLVGATIDYGRSFNARNHLQAAVDTAALTGSTGEFENENLRLDAVNTAFNANFDTNAYGISVTPAVSFDDTITTVSASATVSTMVMGVMSIDDMYVAVNATAIREEGGPICLLALNPTMEKAIDVIGGATLDAITCAIHANSSHNNAIHSLGTTSTTADSICAVGGVVGTGYTPQPDEGCYKVKDPYENLVPPLTGGCDHTGMKLKKGSFTLSPGIYCDGLQLENEAIVTLLPGTYVIKDGGLVFGTKSVASGHGVSFYFTGDDTFLSISAIAAVDLSAPTAGPYDGLVFIQDPTSNPGQPLGKTNLINGSGALNIVGSIYLPTQGLQITGGGHFGAAAPLLTIIVDHLELSATMTLRDDIVAAGMSPKVPKTYDGARLTN